MGRTDSGKTKATGVEPHQAQSTESLPDTPAGLRLRWLLEIVASDATKFDPQEYAHNFSAGWVKDVSADGFMGQLIDLRSKIHPFSISAVHGNHRARLAVTLRCADGKMRHLRIFLEEDEPHGIDGLGISTYEPAPKISATDLIVESPRARVGTRDYGGDGESIVLLHGGGTPRPYGTVSLPG